MIKMTMNYILLLIVVFSLGFQIGKAYIVKGLSYRVEQLHEEGDYRKAWMIEEAIKSYESENESRKN